MEVPDEIELSIKGMVLRYRDGDSEAWRMKFGPNLGFFSPPAPSINSSWEESAQEVLHIAFHQGDRYDHYAFQKPSEPASFSFRPFLPKTGKIPQIGRRH